MNLQFAIAGLLALMGAAIHGGLGEREVVMKLRTDVLAPTRFGGARMTKLMIRVTWHVVTLAFFVIGSSLVVCVPAGEGGACEGIGRVAAASFASFAALAIALGIAMSGARAWRILVRHPGPLVFVAVAALAWWGS